MTKLPTKKFRCSRHQLNHGQKYAICVEAKKKEQWKIYADEIYNVGFKNGRIEMKNKIIKKINQNWLFVTIKDPFTLIVAIMKFISKIK